MQADSTRRIVTVNLPEQEEINKQCAAVMTYGSRRTVKRGRKKHSLNRGEYHVKPCPNKATRIIGKTPYCDVHGPTSRRVDPYYNSFEWKRLRNQVLERDNHVCQYCGNKAQQADHVIARSKGGADAATNLVACCQPCNKLVGGQLFLGFQDKKRWILSNRKSLRKSQS